MQTTVSRLAEWTGLDRRTISKRLAALRPDDQGKVGHFYDSATALRLIYQRADADGVLDPAQEKAMLDKARREQAEIDLQLKRREVIALAECFHVIDAAATACREHLMSLPGRLASVYASESDAMRIESDMESEIRAALNHVVGALEAFKAKEGPSA